MRIRAGLLAVVIVCTACASTDTESAGKTWLVPVPEKDYIGVAWPTPGEIILSALHDPSTSPGTDLLTLSLDELKQVPVPLNDPRCARVDATVLSSLASDRIGFLEWCLSNSSRGFPLPNKAFVASLDLTTGRVVRLMKSPLGFNAHQITWNPSQTSGFASTLAELCGSILAISSDGPQDVPIPIEVGDAHWELDDYFDDLPDASCSRYGSTDWPALSPDGGTLALFASRPDGEGSLSDRLNIPWNLLLMSPTGADLRTALTGVAIPRGLAWSPDGRYLAFAGAVRDMGSGTWVFEPATEELHHVSEARMAWLAWSPRGDAIAGIYNPDVGADSERKQLRIIDVAN